ncbi:MAG: protein kinase domain-containing protein [Gemmatimonadaceae bacterium]
MSEIDPHKAWSDVASLVDMLLDVGPEERPRLIAQLSAGDEVRRRELEQLLDECEREASLLDTPAPQRFAALFEDDVARFPEALAERYRLERTLGRGGMATVYLARDVKHARDVAIKVVHPAVANALGADRFLREIEIVAQLHHPYIMPLFDSGDADGSVYYVMPYEPGASLRQRLVREGALPVDDVIAILRDVCDALAHAHRHGIIHRDIKPDNILLSGRHALVTDFGVATAASQAAKGYHSRSAVTLGTPNYMAPEQIAVNGSVDHRADIYAVGVLGYELLTGRPPFVRETREHLLSAQLSAAPELLTTNRPDVPAPLAALVMKCLEKQPDNRYQTADEIVEQLGLLALPSGATRPAAHSRSSRAAVIGVGAIVVFAVTVFAWKQFSEPTPGWVTRWADARIERVTDFPGSEVDAAISPNGQFAAFLADRDSSFDAFVTRIGSGRFTNLTNGQFPQLYNEDVRNVGFTADDAHVWIRVADIASPASVAVLQRVGGVARPFLPTAVMAVWSPDGSRLAYHETTPGDPVYVADRDGKKATRIFLAEPGVHSHDLAWSPDGQFLYFSHGLPPDEMDIWRIRSDGSGQAERITKHNSRVGYPTLLDDRTLFYTATADDGTGPWLYALDLAQRNAHRVTTSVEHYMSISAAPATPGAPRRLVATVSNPAVSLWSVRISRGVVTEEAASRITLPTARSAAPRFGRDSSLYYLASLGGGDGLWRLAGTTSRELWKSSRGPVAAAPAVSPDGRRVCFPVRRAGRSTLYCTSSDGSSPQPVAESLNVRGPATWSPDGKWIAISAREGASVRVFKIPVGAGEPVRVVDSVSFNPVWSPDGKYILYSGTPRARSAPLKAVTVDGKPYAVPTLLVDRAGDSYRFLPSGKEVVVKLGGFRHQDFWLFNIVTGDRRRLTALRPGESLQRFDVSPDGTRIIFERVRENSDVALIELPAQ